MCGIAGLIDTSGRLSASALESTVAAMAETLRHRGPDGSGTWIDEHAGVALGHRRLAVIDLSEHGHQPMVSRCGRHVLVFNGEIYNYRQLRRALERAGESFAGQCDAEVLLVAIARWGLEAALNRVNGMFAFAIYDAHARTVTLARDRLGEKPLFYGLAGRHLLFASELESFRVHPDFDPEIDHGALGLFLRYTFIPAPHAIYRDVRKLPAGTTLTLQLGSAVRWPHPRPYWRLTDHVRPHHHRRGTLLHPRHLLDELDALIRDAVGLRMHADVPVGAFLSGGIDSALVVAAMQAQSARPVRTFTVAMPSAGIDESAAAAAIARHLGTDHTQVDLSAQDALAVIPDLPRIYDEPFADPSQVPTVLVSRVARRSVTVALSGDGGDESFGGYNRYVLGRAVWHRARRVPRRLRAPAARLLLSRSPAQWDRALQSAAALVPAHLRFRGAGDKAHKLAALLEAETPGAVHQALATHWDPRTLLDRAEDGDGDPWARLVPHSLTEVTERMMLVDSLVSLPDNMLVKVDRASMSVGLEARVPLLDHRIVEYAWSLPLQAKIAGSRGKWALRQILRRYVPDELVEQPKTGFDPPLAEWLRGPLRDWAESLLAPRALGDHDLFEATPIRQTWREHLNGTRNHDYRLWTILMFQGWHQSQQQIGAAAAR